MSFQMEVSAHQIHLWVQGGLGPQEVALLQDALAPLLPGRRRKLCLELMDLPEVDAATGAALEDLRDFVEQHDRRLRVVHAGDLVAGGCRDSAR